MMWKTTGYRIEAAWIKQDQQTGRDIWFLDAVQEHVDRPGAVSTSNICSGTKQHCEDVRNRIVNA